MHCFVTEHHAGLVDWQVINNNFVVASDMTSPGIELLTLCFRDEYITIQPPNKLDKTTK